MGTTRARWSRLPRIGLAFVALACGGGDGGSAPPTVTSVTVSPASATITTGATLQLAATAADRGGASLNRSFTWTSATPGVATVSTSGLVSAVSAGAATITATADGISGTAQITVTPPPVASIAVAPATLGLIVGRTGALTATTRDAAGGTLTGRAVSWTSSNPTIATIVGNGATATVTAVAPGTATLTATSEGVTGTATVTVSPVPVASVVITPGTPSVVRGGTVTLAAATRDSAGATLTGRTVTWTSSAVAIATVSASGSSATVTGVAAGSATITATSEGRSAAVTVSVTEPALLITRDTTLGGTVAVSRVQIPRGITVSVTQPLSLTSTGPVEIHGTLRADCRAVSVTGASLLVRGTVSTACSTPAAGAPLLLRSLGGIRLDSATITGEGGVTVTSRPAAVQGRPARRAAEPDTLFDPCVLQHTTIGPQSVAPAGAAGAPRGADGPTGSTTRVECGGHLQALGLKVYSQGGGAGGRGTSTPTQAAVGGHGGRGGDVIVTAMGKITFEISTLFAQAGGRGGDALDGGAGTVKEGTGGNGGNSGLVMVNGAMGIEVKASGLGVFLNEAANNANALLVRHGGGAAISGDHGVDAGTAPATPGQGVKGTGGTGGSLGDATGVKQVIGDLFVGQVTGAANIDVIAGKAGNGGVAQVRPGDGGKGNRPFPNGAKSGDATSTGGRGGDNRVQDNTKGGTVFPGGPGDGGAIQFSFGIGGLGADGCAVLPWLPGGKGGDGGLSAGKQGDGGISGGGQTGQFGTTTHLQTLVGGNGGPGAGPGAGGAAGLKGHLSAGPVVDDGKSFKPGQPGTGCVSPEIDTRVSPSGGDQSHENFGRMGPRRKKRFRRRDDANLQRVLPAQRALAVHQVTVEGDGPWIPLTGTLDDAGNFAATGLGTYAGFTGIDATYTGKLTLDASGRIIGLTGTLEIGKNGKLPGGQPIIYTLTAP